MPPKGSRVGAAFVTAAAVRALAARSSHRPSVGDIPALIHAEHDTRANCDEEDHDTGIHPETKTADVAT